MLAHGSKDPQWRVPFERIVDAVQGQSGKTKVRLAYMEFIGPTLMDVARECVGQQILHLRILPLFLSIGAHLATDVPEQVNQAKAQFPQLELELLARPSSCAISGCLAKVAPLRIEPSEVSHFSVDS